MFFSLEKSINPRFPCQFSLGRLILNTDNGWHIIRLLDRTLIYKGYMDEACLADQVQWIQDNQHTGNFCVFDHDHSTGMIVMKTSLYRSFLAWHDRDKLTNLFPGNHTVWTNRTASVDQGLNIAEDRINVIGPIDSTPISLDDLIDRVHRRLGQRVKSFLANNRLPLKTFCSGGADSMLVFSYIQAQTKQFEMVWCNHVDWDEFWLQNHGHIVDTFWAYKQMHHWRTPCFLSSGAPGDEFMLRSPTTANAWLLHHGTSIPRELSRPGGDQYWHSDYFSLPKHLDLFKKQQASTTEAKKEILMHNLCDTVLNDCQHWHLGNTLTFTPLRDIEIFKLFLRLPLKDALGQILDSSISRQLIARNDPSLLDYLSCRKNTGDYIANLSGLMSRYPTTSGK